MPKNFLKDMSTSGALIICGQLLITVYSYYGLAMALGIFYLFFGITTAYATGENAMSLYHHNHYICDLPTPTMISDRVRLAKEKHTFNRIAHDQLRRQARIHLLEDKIASKTNQPFRNLPS